MQSTATTRKEMIGRLVDHSVASALSESSQFWLREIFENGFVGYRQFSDQQLRREIQLRGLETTAELPDEEAEDEYPFDLASID